MSYKFFIKSNIIKSLTIFSLSSSFLLLTPQASQSIDSIDPIESLQEKYKSILKILEEANKIYVEGYTLDRQEKYQEALIKYKQFINTINANEQSMLDINKPRFAFEPYMKAFTRVIEIEKLLSAKESFVHPDIKIFDQKYISLATIEPEHKPYTDALVKNLFEQTIGKRFEANNSFSLKSETEFPKWFKEVYKFYLDNAGSISSQKEKTNTKFGSQVVTWNEAQKIIRSSMLIKVKWYPQIYHSTQLLLINDNYKDSDFPSGTFIGRINTILDGKKVNKPYVIDVDKKATLSFMAEFYSFLPLTPGDPYKPSYGTGGPASSWSQKSFATRKDITDVEKSYLKGQPFNPENKKHVALISMLPEYVNRATADINSKETKKNFVDRLSLSQETTYYIRQFEEFKLYGQVQSLRDKADLAEINIGIPNVNSILQIDDALQLVETKQENGKYLKKSLGFLKVRGYSEDNKSLIAQPIILQRELELSDQIIEKPMLGQQYDLGVSSFIYFTNKSSIPLDTLGSMKIYIPFGKFFQISEFYADAELFLGTSIGFTLGATKKWNWRQLWLKTGLSAGLIGFNPGLLPSIGLQYQLNENASFGFDLGIPITFLGIGIGPKLYGTFNF